MYLQWLSQDAMKLVIFFACVRILLPFNLFEGKQSEELVHPLFS